MILLIITYLTINEKFSAKKYKRRWKRKFVRNRWRNRKMYDRYRRKYINYFPYLFPKLKNKCTWVKVCDNGYYYYY